MNEFLLNKGFKFYDCVDRGLILPHESIHYNKHIYDKGGGEYIIILLNQTVSFPWLLKLGGVKSEEFENYLKLKKRQEIIENLLN